MIKEGYRVEHHVLRNYFKKLNILFVESIKIDKEIFSFSFRKLIPLPFIHKQVDYCCLKEKGQQILEALIDIQEDLSQLVFESEENDELVNTLQGYTELSIKAQQTLNTLCRRQYLKSEGLDCINNHEYNHLCKNYFLLDSKRDEQYALHMNIIAQKLGFNVLQKEI